MQAILFLYTNYVDNEKQVLALMAVVLCNQPLVTQKHCWGVFCLYLCENWRSYMALNYILASHFVYTTLHQF